MPLLKNEKKNNRYSKNLLTEKKTQIKKMKQKTTHCINKMESVMITRQMSEKTIDTPTLKVTPGT